MTVKNEGKPLPKGIAGAGHRAMSHVKAAKLVSPGTQPLITWSPPSAPRGRALYVHTENGSDATEWEAVLLALPWRFTMERASVLQYLGGPLISRFTIRPIEGD